MYSEGAVDSDHPRVVVVKRVTHACLMTTGPVIAILNRVVGMIK